MQTQSILLLLTCLLVLQASIVTSHNNEKRSDFIDHEHQANGCGSSNSGQAASASQPLQQQQQQQQHIKRSDLTDRGNAGTGNGCLISRQELDSLKVLLQTQVGTIQNLQDRLSVLETTVQQQQNQTDNTSSTTATAAAVVGFYADFGNEPYHGVLVLPNDTCKFDRVLTNEGNGYDPATGIFTAPVSGLYSFSLHFMGGDHEDMTNLAISILAPNQTQVIAVAYAEGHQRDSNDQGSCTAVAKVEEGEGVSVGLEFGNPLIWGSDVTSFSGMLVQPE